MAKRKHIFFYERQVQKALADTRKQLNLMALDADFVEECLRGKNGHARAVALVKRIESLLNRAEYRA